MIKKLFFSWIAVFLITFGMGSGLASAAQTGNHGLGGVVPRMETTSIYANAFNSFSSRGSLLMHDTLKQFPFEGSIHQIFQSSIEHKTQVVREVTLNLFGPGQVDLAKPINFSGVLKYASSGEGIPNLTVTISTGGFYLGQTHTDNQGVFNLKMTKVLRAGKYLVDATFKGAHLLGPASDTIIVQVMPSIVHIQTVPAVAGITFQMAGRQFVSGPDGTASIDVLQAGQYKLDILLDKFHDPSQEVEFGRWAFDSYRPSREVDVPSDAIVQVGLNLFHRVAFKFIDLDGYPVDTSRITSIGIRSVQGDVFSLKPGDTPWLPASRTARRSLGLQETDLLYSVNSVIIDGSNVVNTSQQRFFARSDDSWTITLLLYSLQINARDGLFASPIGKSVNVVFPDGQIKNYEFPPSGKLEIHALARGIYHISLIGVSGLGTSTPVALSRNQVVKLNVVTKLDFMVAGLIALGFAVGLVLYGRPQLVKNVFKRKRSTSPGLEWTTDHEN